MDEPSAILDDGEIETLFAVVRRLTDEGVGVVYISHRLDEIRRIGDRVTVLADGRTAATGLPATTPTGELVAHMIGRKVEQLYPERPIGDRRGAPRRPRRQAAPRGPRRVAAGQRRRGAGPRRAGRLRPQRAPGPDLRHRATRRGRGVDGRAPAATRAALGRDRRRARPRARGPQVPGPAPGLAARQEREPGGPRPLHAGSGCSTSVPSAKRSASSCARSTPSPTTSTASCACSRAATSRRSCWRGGCCASAACSCSTSPPAASTSRPRPSSTG